MIDVKFCPACGSQVLYEMDGSDRDRHTDNPAYKCHGCGEEFTVLAPEDLQELEEAFEERDAYKKKINLAVEQMEAAVKERTT